MAHEFKRQTNVGVHNAMLLSTHDTPFDYHGWSTITNHSFELRSISPQRDVSGSPDLVEFKLPKTGDKIGKIWLTWTWQAVTGGIQGGGTFRRLVDYAPYRKISKIEYIYVNTPIRTTNGDDLWLRHRQEDNVEEHEGEVVRVKGDLTTAERDALALGEQEIWVELHPHWTTDPSKYFIPNAQSHEMTINVHLEADRFIIQSDWATTSTMSVPIKPTTMKIKYIEYSFDPDERSHHIAKTQQKDGLVYMVHDMERQPKNTIPTGTVAGVEFPIKLSSIKSPVYDLRFIVRNYNDVYGTAAQVKPYENILKIRAWKIVANGKDIVPLTTDFENVFVLNPLYFPCMPGDKIYGDSHSLAPTDKQHASGMLTYGYLNDPQLVIILDVTTQEDLTVDIFANIHNFVQHHHGDMRKIFY
jgi:hypothetical protein